MTEMGINIEIEVILKRPDNNNADYQIKERDLMHRQGTLVYRAIVKP